MSKLSLEALQVLESIHRLGTFALAAEELHRVPSALTYTVNNLEQQLKVKIFDRSGHRAKLTQMGELVLKEGQKLLMSAALLEKRVQLQQQGFENTLLVAYDQIIPFKNLCFLIEEFYQACEGVELKISAEILGGCWDALLSHRATIAIGATGDPPIREDISVTALGTAEFVFLVSKHHPLASKEGYLSNDDIKLYRGIVVADSTRGLSQRNTGILPEQSTLTVSTFQEKIDLMLAGLGIGYLPLGLAKKYIASGELLVKQVSRLKSKGFLSIAWRPSLVGKAGLWFIKKLSDKKVAKRILQV